MNMDEGAHSLISKLTVEYTENDEGIKTRNNEWLEKDELQNRHCSRKLELNPESALAQSHSYREDCKQNSNNFQ